MRAVTELRTASTSCIAHTYTPDTLSALTQRYRLLHAGLLFFTTYTLLVLFWAEIYHQARSMPTGSLRPIFAGINIVVYAVLVRFMGGRQLCRLLAHLGSSLFKNGRIACGQKACWPLFADHTCWRVGKSTLQAALWTWSTMATDPATATLGYLLSDVFVAAVSVFAATGFILYGGRLYLMLQRFPIESRGRRKKLQEVGLVTSICAACFTIRCGRVVPIQLAPAGMTLHRQRLSTLNAPPCNACSGLSWWHCRASTRQTWAWTWSLILC